MSRQRNQTFTRTHRAKSVELDKGSFGRTWDAKHLDSFINHHSYSKVGHPSTVLPHQPAKKLFSSGEHFFRTTKDNKNQSKIGYTPIQPLVGDCPIDAHKLNKIKQFFESQITPDENRMVNGRKMKLRCESSNQFKFEGNAVKFQYTDPLTLKNQQHSSNYITGYQKQRMHRLITKRHPHGITGIDHPEIPQPKFYQKYEERYRVRQQPNSHRSFVLDKDWNEKKRSVRPVDVWKHRQTVTVRKFRNDDAHGYNIITNRKIDHND